MLFRSIARKLDRAEREFRTPQSKVRKISHRAKHLLAHECHFAHLKPIFAPCETRCENFAHHYLRCEIHSKVRKSQLKVHQFRTPQSKVRKIFVSCETPPGTRVPFRTPQANFRMVRNKVRIPQSKVWKFRTMQFKVRNSHFKVRKFCY